jgi:hypothetical protein
MQSYCIAGGNGAAVAVNSTVIPGTCKQAQDCAVLVTSSKFVQNTASLGSALYVISNQLQVNISGSLFMGTAPDVAASATSMCPSMAGSNASVATYLDMQCSTGYRGPLCSICQKDHGISGQSS